MPPDKEQDLPEDIQVFNWDAKDNTLDKKLQCRGNKYI